MARKTGDPAGNGDEDAPIRIKKYANRRLYNTSTSSYVTLEDLSKMVKDGQDFVVNDAKSGDDITRSVLTQIIVEEEAKGENMLPIGFLRQLISLYGDNMQWMVPRYLEHAMQNFANNQDQLRDYVQGTMQGMFPFNSMNDTGKQNMAMMESAMKMFSPFQNEGGQPNPTRQPPQQQAPGSSNPAADPRAAQQINELQQQLDILRAEMASQSKNTNKKTSE